MEKIRFERFDEKEIDHAGDRRINEGERGGCQERIAIILEQNSGRSNSNRSTVDTMSVWITELG